jgi:hypothetical protein
MNSSHRFRNAAAAPANRILKPSRERMLNFPAHGHIRKARFHGLTGFGRPGAHPSGRRRGTAYEGRCELLGCPPETDLCGRHEAIEVFSMKALE